MERVCKPLGLFGSLRLKRYFCSNYYLTDEMRKSPGISIKKPVSIWNKEINVEFRELFDALAKALLSASVGAFNSSITSLVDSVAAFKTVKDPGILTWLLIYRSISKAMFSLIEDNILLLRESTSGFAAPEFQRAVSKKSLKKIAYDIDYAIEAKDLTIDKNFFENPGEFLLMEDLKDTLADWLQNLGLNTAQALSITARFPAYFVFALNDEWRTRRDAYNAIVEALPTPFTKASEKELAWLQYYALLERRVNEPIFQDAVSLRQIFIPLRAFFEFKEKETYLDHQSPAKSEDKYKIKVVDVMSDLENWIASEDRSDAVRAISGGPGYGKSTISKMLAASAEKRGERRILYIPLHLLQIDERIDLGKAVDEFVKTEGYLPDGLLDSNFQQKLLLIFDGLDEISMQGRVGNQVAQEFVKKVLQRIVIVNQTDARLKVLLCGRDIAIQTNKTLLGEQTRVLHLLPYYVGSNLIGEIELNLGENTKIVSTDKLTVAQKKVFKRRRDIVNELQSTVFKDQRNEWWQKYGKVTGIGFTSVPGAKVKDEKLKRKLDEITALPLLNYLFALSHIRGGNDFDERTSLNTIYQDLLSSVFDRGRVWADTQHRVLDEISREDFFRILEEIAIAAWHGDGRKISIKEIESRFENNELRLLLERFKERAKDGVASLLLAFYFRRAGKQDLDGNETFEFTHKSFGEYLTSLRIVRGIRQVTDEMAQRKSSYESGWSEVDALVNWISLCGPRELDRYLVEFIHEEIALYKPESVLRWQNALSKLLNHVLLNGMPMEKLGTARPKNFKEDIRYARNAEEALLVVLSACSLKTKTISNIQFPDGKSFLELVRRLYSEIVNSSLTFLPLGDQILNGENLSQMDLRGSDFQGTSLEETDMEEANLEQAKLNGVNLENANLKKANLSKTDLRGAKLRGANLFQTDLYDANLLKAIWINGMPVSDRLSKNIWRLALNKKLRIGTSGDWGVDFFLFP